MSRDKKYQELERLSKELSKLSPISKSYLETIISHITRLLNKDNLGTEQNIDEHISFLLAKLSTDEKLKNSEPYQKFSELLLELRINELLKAGVSPTYILQISGGTHALLNVSKNMEVPFLKEEVLPFWEENQHTLSFEDKRLFNLMLLQVMQLEGIKAENGKSSYNLLASLKIFAQSFSDPYKEKFLKYVEQEETTTFAKKSADEKMSKQSEALAEIFYADLKELNDMIESPDSPLPKELREAASVVCSVVEKHIHSTDFQQEELDFLWKAISYTKENLSGVLENNQEKTVEYAILLASLSKNLPGRKSEYLEKIGKGLVVIGALSLGAAGLTVVATLALPGVGILLGTTLAVLFAGGALASFMKSKDILDEASEKGPAKGVHAFKDAILKHNSENPEGIENIENPSSSLSNNH